MDDWTSAVWLEEATAWIDAQLAARGTARSGRVEQPRVRPWATVLRVPTTDGVVWLKAGGAGTGYEAGLCELLGRLVPDRVLVPLAVDAGRGWVLLPDGGPSLHERGGAATHVDAMARALRLYAGLQRAVAPEADTMLALGVADMRPERMPERFEQALALVTERAGDDADGLIPRLGDVRGDVAAWAQRLAGGPIPASLDHNDLHTDNVLGEPGGPARFYDWGDSVVTHPFGSLLLPLTEVERLDPRHGGGEPGVARLRDAYLEGWADLAPHAELVAIADCACRVAKVTRALTWERAVVSLGADAGDWARAPIACMASVLDPSPLGGA